MQLEHITQEEAERLREAGQLVATVSPPLPFSYTHTFGQLLGTIIANAPGVRRVEEWVLRRRQHVFNKKIERTARECSANAIYAELHMGELVAENPFPYTVIEFYRK